MHPFINIATAAARKSGQLIEQSLERLASIKITEKKHNDFVTEIDRASEERIVAHIRKAYPEHKILAEESTNDSALLNESDYLWIIDPLDGTRNFIQGFPHYAISIALQIKGRLEHGVVFDPIRKEMFTASRGQGAFLNNRRIRTTIRNKLEHAMIGTGFPFHNKALLPDFLKTFEAVFYECGSARRTGSAALDLAYVAAGRLDGFWEFQLQPWDIAAGVLLVQEAGGLVVDFKGAENYMKSGNIIAGNPKLVKHLNQLIYNALIGVNNAPS